MSGTFAMRNANAIFERVIEGRVRSMEGGYSNHPSDRGGETNHGITVAVARAFGFTRPMRDMTWEEAKAIYRARYWEQPRFDALAFVSPAVAEWLLDTGINMGQGAAGQMLQRLLNLLNNGGEFYSDLTVDGACGAMKRAALQSLIQRRGREPVERLLPRALAALQFGRYAGIMEGIPSHEAFGWGWLTRAFG